MSAAGVRPRVSRILCPVAAVVLVYAGAIVTPATAVVSDPCGLITQFEISRAFGLTDTVKHSTLVAAPGNPAGVVRNRCDAFAWSGPKPTNAKRKRESLLDGTLARLNIQSWVPDEGPQSQVWRMGFDATLKRVRGAASDLFLKELGGTRFLPLRLGAESSVGFSAAPGQTRRVRALWWSRNAKSLIVIDAVEAKGQPTVGALKQVAAIVVSEFFRPF
jgi:hypothetical protein